MDAVRMSWLRVWGSAMVHGCSRGVSEVLVRSGKIACCANVCLCRVVWQTDGATPVCYTHLTLSTMYHVVVCVAALEVSIQ